MTVRTPDLSHVDQLTFVIRYVKDRIPVERFLKFIPIKGHKSEYLAETILFFLENHDIAIKDCRGQSYDNASNMSGKYTGLQARIKEKCEFATYVPCAAHSLRQRLSSYENISKRFSLFCRLKSLNPEELRQSCKEFAEIYYEDVNEKELEIECVHLTEYLKNIQRGNETTNSTILEVYHILKEHQIYGHISKC